MNLRANLFGWDKIIMIAYLAAATQAANAGGESTVKERSLIAEEYRWATEEIFASTKDWETAFADTKQRVAALAKHRDTLSQSADHLYSVLQERDNTEAQLDKVYVYASLLADQDTRKGDQQGMKSRARSLATKYSEATSWMEPELTSIPFERLDSWMRESPKLGGYRQAFDDLFRKKKHILSAREEELLAMAGEIRSTPSNVYNLLTNADISFPSIKDEQGNERELDDSAFYLFMRSSDRRVRKDAYEAIVGTYARYRNTAAALLSGVVQTHLYTVKARGYESSLAAALHEDNIPIGVYNTLVRTVNEHLPLLHRYQTLRKRVLGFKDGVHAYDLFAPFIADQTMKYSYEGAIATIEAALEPLGKEYLEPMGVGFRSRWVDVYPTKGKRSGAYSSGTFLTSPFILMNFHGGYEDMSTLAHEMGHSMHSYYSRSAQPYVYSDYTIFCAEVASTCNEIILQDHVLKNTHDPKKKLYLLGEFLEGIRGTVFRQTMFSEFEQRIHELAEADQPLTADVLAAEYRKVMTKYYGPSYVHDDLVDNYWIRIPHFYYNFYVYKYATSYCAASNIAARIMKGEPGARDAYLSFLKAGSSKYSIDLLKMARVDMTTPQPVEDAMGLFENLLDQTEALLTELKMLD